jgi:aminotransferase
VQPDGRHLHREQLEKIAAFCREKDLLVLSDEIYSELTFEGTHTSIASLPGMAERTIFLHGFSKAFAMTGWRIGYACGPAPLIDAMMKVHQYAMMCASIIAQEGPSRRSQRLGRGAQDARAIPPPPRPDCAPFQRNRPQVPLAARIFYAFPDVTATGLSEKDFAVGLLSSRRSRSCRARPSARTAAAMSAPVSRPSYEQIGVACDRIERVLVQSRPPC